MKGKMCGVLLLAWACFGTAQVFSDTGIDWALGLMKIQPDGNALGVSYSRPVDFITGDRFYFLVKTDILASLVVLQEDSQGVLTLIFTGQTKPGELLFFPQGNQAYRLQLPSGTEHFHFVLSRKPLDSLTALLSDLESPDARSRVLDEITKLRKEGSALTESPVRPVPIAGVVKGAPGLTISGFSGKDTYVKTIRIDH